MERPAERVSVRLRRHPLLVDGAIAVILLTGTVNAFGNATVLPASLVLAGTVAVRSRFPVAAYATALAVGVAQVAVGIGSTYTDSPLQPTFADVGILLLLYTVAAERTRRISLPGLAACVVLFAAAVARYNPGADRAQHPVEFILVTALFCLLAPVSAWVHISEATVKTHVGHIMAKLRLRDRIRAVVYAYETGLIAPRPAGTISPE